MVTPLQGLELELAGDAMGNVLDRQLESRPDVLTAALGPPGSLAAAEQRVEPPESTEVPHEDAEGLGQIHVVEPKPASTATADAGHAKAVVLRPLPGITQDLVRLRDLLELLFRRLFTVVAVGMVLHGQPAVGLLYLRVRGVGVYAEDVVQILCHRSVTLGRGR